jgi:5-methylcytosine-specific restriction endonuclease McrA
MDYQLYLQSDHWRRMRAAALAWSGECALCASHRHLEVHHRRYDRLWRERLTDLVVLCSRCHRRHHATLEEAPEQLVLPLAA